MRGPFDAAMPDQIYARAVNGQSDTEFEHTKWVCADVASQMRCPRHYKSAKVEIAGEGFEDFSFEVVACCEEFRRRVEEALDTRVTHGV